MRELFGLGGLAHFSDHVNGLVLRLVVGARHDLREQSHRDELHAGENQQHAEQQQRPVGDRLVAEQPLVGQIRGDQRTREVPSARR